MNQPPVSQQHTPEADSQLNGQWLLLARLGIAFAAAVATLFIGLNTAGNISDASEFGASAIQIIELYTEGIFWFIFTLALAVSGYIGTRWTV